MAEERRWLLQIRLLTSRSCSAKPSDPSYPLGGDSRRGQIAHALAQVRRGGYWSRQRQSQALPSDRRQHAQARDKSKAHRCSVRYYIAIEQRVRSPRISVSCARDDVGGQWFFFSPARTRVSVQGRSCAQKWQRAVVCRDCRGFRRDPAPVRWPVKYGTRLHPLPSSKVDGRLAVLRLKSGRRWGHWGHR